MSLLLSTLLEFTAPDGKQEVVRVLHIDPSADSVQVIGIDRSDALPEARRLSEIEVGLADNRIRVLTADPFAYLQMPEELIPRKTPPTARCGVGDH